MREDRIEIPSELSTASEQLDEVILSETSAAEFWEKLLQSYCLLSASPRAILLVCRNGEKTWRKVAYCEAPELQKDRQDRFEQLALQAADLALQETGKALSLKGSDRCLLGVRLRLLGTDNSCVAVFMLDAKEPKALRETAGRLELVASMPKLYEMRQRLQSSRDEREVFASVIEIVGPVNDEERFLAAALALCNGVATELECERVSLGWWEKGFVRLKAISRMEKFNREMAAAQDLEAAMDEVIDQDVEVVFPCEDVRVIARDHEKFCQKHHVNHMISLPIRVADGAEAVLSCERQKAEFTVEECQQLRLVTNLITSRLVDLHARDRWLGFRMAARCRRNLARLVGPENTWAKALALLVTALIIALVFVKVDYRVEGNFSLRSDEVVYLTAPFDGYIEEVHAEAPASVNAGEPLLGLRTDELELQEAAELANVNAYKRQVERARAGNQLADMRIAQAQAEQAGARLAIVRDQLDQANIVAPFDGVLVEGDLKELRGKPIEKGSPLYKLVQLNKLCVDASIDERDVDEVQQSKTGEIAFVSQPKFRFPVKVTQLEAAAFPEGEGNVFQVRCDFINSLEPWWRPGMTGVVKIDAGKRSLMWIIGHRTVDFLRLWLWW